MFHNLTEKENAKCPKCGKNLGYPLKFDKEYIKYCCGVDWIVKRRKFQQPSVKPSREKLKGCVDWKVGDIAYLAGKTKVKVLSAASKTIHIEYLEKSPTGDIGHTRYMCRSFVHRFKHR